MRPVGHYLPLLACSNTKRKKKKKDTSETPGKKTVFLKLEQMQPEQCNGFTHVTAGRVKHRFY